MVLKSYKKTIDKHIKSIIMNLEYVNDTVRPWAR